MKNKIDHNKWQDWHWESENRYYKLSLSQTLFGEWILIKKWGGKYTRIHGSKIEYYKDIHNEDEINAIFGSIQKRRASRGYILNS